MCPVLKFLTSYKIHKDWAMLVFCVSRAKALVLLHPEVRVNFKKQKSYRSLFAQNFQRLPTSLRKKFEVLPMVCTRLTRPGPQAPMWLHLLSLAPSPTQLQPHWLPHCSPNTPYTTLIPTPSPSSGHTFLLPRSFPAHLRQNSSSSPVPFLSMNLIPPIMSYCYLLHHLSSVPPIGHILHVRWTIILFTVECPAPGMCRSPIDICWMNESSGLAENC